MRIIAGRWRGRRLAAPAGQDVRPTTDRAREALFSILGGDVAGAVVLDLCCGAGGLGLEALSRGAARAVFVDRDRRALAALRANLGRCGAAAAEHEVVPAEAAAWLDRWPGAGGRPWLLLADPPYAGGLAAAIIGRVAAGGLPAGLVAAAVEHGAQTPDVDPVPAGWDLRRYGQSRFALWRAGRGGTSEEERP